MKIVVSNSVGIDSNGYYIIHSPSRWSEGVKSKYNWFTYYPWELAYLSSLLKRETCEDIKFIDGCLERLDYVSYLKRLEREEPDWLIMESASRIIAENIKLAMAIKQRLGTKVVFCGQHSSAFPEEVLKQGIDYVAIGEYEFTVLELIQGKDPGDILGLYPNCRRPLININELPWPEDEDVSRINYGIPGEPSSEYLETQMYASRGCPKSCNFCVARNIYYNQPNWRARKVEDIVAEIAYLKNKYPMMEGIFFDEEVHNLSKEFILKLTKGIHKNRLDGLYYEAMCDVRALDREMMEAMYEAGYYKIRVGLETASKSVSEAIKKEINIPRIISTLREAKNIGLKTYGTFMMGAPGSTKSEDIKTIDLIKRLGWDGLLDNIQISICTPQPGTPFYSWAERNGHLISNDFCRFDGGNFAVISYPYYSSEEIEEIKSLAFGVRDHIFLVKRIRSKLWKRWMKNIYLKYGLRGLIYKFFKRMKVEFNYLKARIKCL